MSVIKMNYIYESSDTVLEEVPFFFLSPAPVFLKVFCPIYLTSFLWLLVVTTSNSFYFVFHKTTHVAAWNNIPSPQCD